MNIQQLAANEYKDYILGFIFYKYLSDKEILFAKKELSSLIDELTGNEFDMQGLKEFKSFLKSE